jgi:hypothetical protein
MEHYLGERSPYVNDIRKGVETRNALVHRPRSDAIGSQEAFDYVDMVDAAILHALLLTTPDDRLLKRRYSAVAATLAK